MTAPEDSAAGLAGQLQAAITGLEGYIERRAAELAAPRIADAQERAAAETGRLRAELARSGDLVAELRTRIEGLEDRLDDLRVLHGERRDARVAAPPPGPDRRAPAGWPAWPARRCQVRRPSPQPPPGRPADGEMNGPWHRARCQGAP